MFGLHLRARPACFLAWGSLHLAAQAVAGCFALLAGSLPALDAAAQTPAGALTEQRAVALALSRNGLRDAVEGAVDAARAEVVAAGLWPNPVVEYEREHIGRAAGDSTEETYRISQPFDLSGRRALGQAAAELRVDASRANGSARRQEIAAETRRAFYETLHQTRLLDAATDWTRRITFAGEVVERLVRGSEASGYDANRLTRERVMAEARAEQIAAERMAAWERLRGHSGDDLGPNFPPLAGSLLPPAPPPLEAALEAVRHRPDLVRLAAQAHAFDLDRQAGARGWLPEITLGVAGKRIDDPEGSDSGIVVSVGIPLPLFDRGQAAAEQAIGEARAARGERLLVEAQALAAVRGLWRQTTMLRAASLRFRDRALAQSRDLANVAESAYRAGEMTLLELLDAYRSLLEAETVALDLEAKARGSEIDLRLAIGETVP